MLSEDFEQDRRMHRPWGNPGFRHLVHIKRVQLGQRGFLRPEVIQLLEQRPMSGVDIMRRMQEMSRGWYRPSPGSIYPILEQLEKEGLIAKNKEGKYELTTNYRKQSGMAGDISDAMTAMEGTASYLEDLQSTGGADLSVYRDRIEKLAKRLDALGSGPHSGGGT